MLIFGRPEFLGNRTVSQRLAALFPQPAAPRQAVELAAFISKYADPQAGQSVYRQLTVDQSYSFSPEDYFAYIQKITAESEFFYKDRFYEKSEKDPFGPA